eukprot:Skav225491  [mRNA]  locus=scaffold1821:3404:13961:+ [translate_table: standard]
MLTRRDAQSCCISAQGSFAMAKLLSLLLLFQAEGTALRALNEASVPDQGAVVAHLLSVVDDYLDYYAEEESHWSESKKRMTDIIKHAPSEESRMASVNQKARMKKEHDKTVAEYVTVVKKLDKALTEMEGAEWAAKHGVQVLLLGFGELFCKHCFVTTGIHDRFVGVLNSAQDVLPLFDVVRFFGAQEKLQAMYKATQGKCISMLHLGQKYAWAKFFTLFHLFYGRKLQSRCYPNLCFKASFGAPLLV